VHDADLICAVTRSPDPVVCGAYLRPGTHVNAVGASTATTRELDSDAIAMARVVVDSRAAAEHEAGDLLIPIQEGRIGIEHVYAELGDVVVGARAGRQSDSEVTVYKSLGVAIQDVAAASAAYSRATALGIGTDISL
jgi:ornithine cyclodeaminase/alanine dehydrogenase-like protein (mu-crystallin family)